MRAFLNILLLSPILIYWVLLSINSNLLTQKETINLFWITQIEIPIIAIITIFFISHVVIVFSLSKFSNFFIAHRNKKLSKTVNELKARMLDREPELLDAIEQKFEDILKKSQDENKQNIDIIRKENEKVVTNLNYDLKMIKEKLENIKS